MALLQKVAQIRVGISCAEKHFECLWFNDQQQPHFYQLQKQSDQPLEQQIIQQIKKTLVQPRKIKVQFVSAILPHQLWLKTLIFPHILNATECEQQCQYLLEKELPIPIEELWFDYTTSLFKQGMRFDLFALKSEIGQQHLRQFYPLKISILDTAPHCLLKAVKYLKPDFDQQNTLFIYQDDQFSIALRNSAQEWQLVSQSCMDINQLYQQFTQRYGAEITQILVYKKQQLSPQLAQPHQTLTSEFPLIALGCALWQKDLVQNE